MSKTLNPKDRPLTDTAEKLEAWCRDYNEVRLHGAIGNKTPIALINPGDTASLSP